MWFGFTGMFSLGLAKQLSEPIRDNHVDAKGKVGFGVIGLFILSFAYLGGLWFWISGTVYRVSFWYGALAPVVVLLLIITYQSLRARA